MVVGAIVQPTTNATTTTATTTTTTAAVLLRRHAAHTGAPKSTVESRGSVEALSIRVRVRKWQWRRQSGSVPVTIASGSDQRAAATLVGRRGGKRRRARAARHGRHAVRRRERSQQVRLGDWKEIWRRGSVKLWKLERVRVECSRVNALWRRRDGEHGRRGGTVEGRGSVSMI
jgi:hypothetical protein